MKPSILINLAMSVFLPVTSFAQLSESNSIQSGIQVLPENNQPLTILQPEQPALNEAVINTVEPTPTIATPKKNTPPALRSQEKPAINNTLQLGTATLTKPTVNSIQPTAKINPEGATPVNRKRLNNSSLLGSGNSLSISEPAGLRQGKTKLPSLDPNKPFGSIPGAKGIAGIRMGSTVLGGKTIGQETRGKNFGLRSNSLGTSSLLPTSPLGGNGLKTKLGGLGKKTNKGLFSDIAKVSGNSLIKAGDDESFAPPPEPDDPNILENPLPPVPGGSASTPQNSDDDDAPPPDHLFIPLNLPDPVPIPPIPEPDYDENEVVRHVEYKDPNDPNSDDVSDKPMPTAAKVFGRLVPKGPDVDSGSVDVKSDSSATLSSLPKNLVNDPSQDKVSPSGNVSPEQLPVNAAGPDTVGPDETN
jgi:hypothetical protein